MHCDNQTPILKPALINFPAFLRMNAFAAFSRWILLNDIVRQEHPAQLPLIEIGMDDPVYMELVNKYFNSDFLRLDNEGKRNLNRLFL